MIARNAGLDMKHIQRFFCGLTVGLWAVTVPAHASQPDCRSLFNTIQEKGNAATLSELRGFFETSLRLPDCDDKFRSALGKKVSGKLIGQVDSALKSGAQPASQKTTLEESLTYYRNWQVLAMLGDIASDARERSQATRRYQEALEVIEDEGLTPKPPPVRVIEGIFKKAETQRLLAENYVPAPRNRNGKPTGLGAANVRGFIVKKTAIPITFKFDSVEFDAKGKAAANDLLQHLKSRGSPAITLVGHTDRKGAAAYNQTLSERRATALGKFLTSAGYSGAIKAAGRGKSEPYKPAPGAYGQDEIDRLNRRVELLK